MSLIKHLDLYGWPLHLRAMDTASWQLVAGASWALEDRQSLKTLFAHGVSMEDIAQSFFEGRTVYECQDVIESMKVRESMSSTETGQLSGTDLDATKAASPHAPSTKAIPSPPTPSAATPFKNRLIEVASSGSRARSATPHADSRKDWEQKDCDIVWKGVQLGMTPCQIQAEYLPFRSESAIQTRMTKERKLRGVQATPTKWSKQDKEIVMKLADEGHDFESIAPRLSRERTPSQIEARYRDMKKQSGASQTNVEVSHVDDDGDVEMPDENSHMADEDAQMAAGEEEGSEYNEETSGAVQPPRKPKTARKSILSNSSPNSSASTKKTPKSIASIRTKLLNSISARQLNPDQKKQLRKELNRIGWPTRFASLEEHESPLPGKSAKWLDQDLHALRCIREIAPSIPHRVLVDFFPGRSETAIRNVYNTKVRQN